MFYEDDLLQISALQHLLFCPRQCALIHVERLWAENQFTVQGRHLHENPDKGKRQRQAAQVVTRALPLRSLQHGLYGTADVVEFHSSTTMASADASDASAKTVPFPIEYKRGRPKRNDCDRVQLCAQALCLEEMLKTPVPCGAIFYGRTRRRLDVVFDDVLRTATLDAIHRLHELIESRVTPSARLEKKCDRCSLRRLCMPEVLEGSESASRYLSRSLAASLAAVPASD